MPCVRCAVIAVIADVPRTAMSANVRRSAWIPAPPLESLPAMVKTTGTTGPTGTTRTRNALSLIISIIGKHQRKVGGPFQVPCTCRTRRASRTCTNVRISSVTARAESFLDASISHSALAPLIRAGAVGLAVIVTSVAAQISVPLPFTPVPLVLTPLAVLMSSALLGSRLGMIAQVAYLLAGVAGLPVFAPSAQLPPGALRLVGPTGGYLMAYPIAAFVTGALAERGWDRRVSTAFAALAAGLVIIFTGGVSWLALAITHSWSGAVTAGLRWFIVLDLLKLAAGALVLPQAWKLLKSRT